MYNSNYNQKNEFYTKDVKKFKISEVADQLKLDIKEFLKAPRTVRDLNPFCIFYKALKLQQKTNSSVWISTKKLKSKAGFNIHQDDYQKWFDACVAEWENTEFNKGNYLEKAKCRTIKSFTPQFIELCEKYDGIQFENDFYKRYYRSITDFSKSQINKLREIYKKNNNRDVCYISGILRNDNEDQGIEKNNQSDVCYISGILTETEFEEILNEDFYHSTEDSPFRVYHNLQLLTKSVKREMFNGYYDIDLQCCFASIAWNILDMKNCELKDAWLLNPEFKNRLRQKIKDELNLETLDEAKQQVCALFNKEFAVADKLDWYKALHQEIIDRTKKHLNTKVQWKGNEEKIDTMHKFFTYHEQMIIAKLSQECEVILNMHDGVIATNRPKNNFVEYLGFEFSLSIDEFVDIKFVKETDYNQKQQELFNMNMISSQPIQLNKDYKEKNDNKNSFYDIQEQPDLIWKHLL